MFDEEVVTQEDWQVFKEYGRTMFSVQLFEMSLAGVVYSGGSADHKKLHPNPTVLEETMTLFNLTAGQLKAALKKQEDVPEDLLEAVEIAVENRNELVHRYLLNYRAAKLADPQAHHTAIADLREAQECFQALAAWLEELRDRKGLENVDGTSRKLTEVRHP